MARPEKEAAIEELKTYIANNSIVILSQYHGISVAEVTELRSKLRAENVKFKVYKNTLAKRALDELDLSEVNAYMEGPTVWAFCDDPVAPAKILKRFSKQVDAIRMRGGILEGKPITAEMLNSLADLPAREQLLAHVVGTFAMPLRQLVGALSALPRNLVWVMDAICRKKEEEQAV